MKRLFLAFILLLMATSFCFAEYQVVRISDDVVIRYETTTGASWVLWEGKTTTTNKKGVVTDNKTISTWFPIGEITSTSEIQAVFEGKNSFPTFPIYKGLE